MEARNLSDQDICWNQRFASTLRLAENGAMQMDLRAFHDTVPA